jgi:hypothetical protein
MEERTIVFAKTSPSHLDIGSYHDRYIVTMSGPGAQADESYTDRRHTSNTMARFIASFTCDLSWRLAERYGYTRSNYLIASLGVFETAISNSRHVGGREIKCHSRSTPSMCLPSTAQNEPTSPYAAKLSQWLWLVLSYVLPCCFRTFVVTLFPKVGRVLSSLRDDRGEDIIMQYLRDHVSGVPRSPLTYAGEIFWGS